ncbi:MAG: hypothetical protein AABO41_01600 [Acidobacteriota bacterium]
MYPHGSPNNHAKLRVEPFFSEDTNDALLSQVQWFQDRFVVSDDFFVDMLNIEKTTFGSWKYSSGLLSKDKQKLLSEFWEMLMHVMSFYDYDVGLVLLVFRQEGGARESAVSPLCPPWAGTSLRNYLEKTGPQAIREANQWIQTLRYANWY